MLDDLLKRAKEVIERGETEERKMVLKDIML